MLFRSFSRFMVQLFFCCAFILLTLASVGHAECNLPTKQKLTNKALLNAISKTEYAKWTLYGPKDSEIVGKNVYATDFFKNTTAFPIVAVNDDQIVLLIMQRINNSWHLLCANENALVRDDFVLYNFDIGISGYSENSSGVLVSFNFKPQSLSANSSLRYDLYMYINGRDGFISVSVIDQTTHDLEQFRQQYSVHIMDKTLKYWCQDYKTLRSIYYLAGPNPVDCSFANFDLSAVPLMISDVMSKTQICSTDHQPVCLYQSADSESFVLTEIPDRTVVLAIPEPVTTNGVDWCLVQYENYLGYIHYSKIENNIDEM